MLYSAKRRALLFAFLTILTCAVFGGLLGPRARAAAQPEDDLRQSIKAFAGAFHLIEENYADPVNADTAIYNGAIPGMLHKLDPHSQFFDPEQFSGLREEQEGRYAGVGMQVATRNRKTIVISPFPNTPAFRAGIRPGDTILKVDGESTAGLNTTEVAKRLRGEKGTTVQITLEREGRPGPFEVSVVRDEIPRKSVSTAFFVKPEIGYIKVDTFSETTGKEVTTQLRNLEESGIRGLVLDLRDNRGGLLSEGVAVADKFLRKGQTIVSHHGRASAEKPYRAQRGNGGRNYPMVVMVNCESASAAEIVAGALQDHDRALIVGSSTFGKGLVQTEYPLNQSSGLLLTTARYYTPSGRLIQRSYNNISLYDYYSDPCRDQHRTPKLELKLTDSRRTVYGGDGITPDVRFPAHTPDRFQNELLVRRLAFLAYAHHYFASHESLPPKWEPDAATLNDFRQFLYSEKISFTEPDFTRNLDFIKRNLKREIYVYAYDQDEGEKVRAETDPDVQAALELLPKAQQLTEQASRLMAQRTGR
ncbi:MAG: S41 family peptidase [Acidobacteria bacterium]|nr:S41 family peptidase [Acidobacteriota bacterium]